MIYARWIKGGREEYSRRGGKASKNEETIHAEGWQDKAGGKTFTDLTLPAPPSKTPSLAGYLNVPSRGHQIDTEREKCDIEVQLILYYCVISTEPTDRSLPC